MKIFCIFKEEPLNVYELIEKEGGSWWSFTGSISFAFSQLNVCYSLDMDGRKFMDKRFNETYKMLAAYFVEFSQSDIDHRNLKV